jgi:hypothetical protein
MMRRVVLAGLLSALTIGATATMADAGLDDSRPDARLSLQAPEELPEIGDDIYEDLGQQYSFGINPGATALGKVRFQNDAEMADTLRVGAIAFVRGNAPNPTAALQVGDDYKVRFRLKGENVTRKVAANKLKFHDVAPGAIAGALRVEMTLDDEAEDVQPLGVVVHVTSANDRTEQDVASFTHQGVK